MNAQRLLWGAASNFETAEFQFYGALAQAAACDFASGDGRRRHFEALVAHHGQLEAWAQHNPVTFEAAQRSLLRKSPGLKAVCSKPKTFSRKPCVRRTATAFSTWRGSPTSWPDAFTLHAASRRLRRPIFAMRAPAIAAGAAMQRFDNSSSSIRRSERGVDLRCDNDDTDTRRPPRSGDRDQGVRSGVGRDRIREADRHHHAHGNRARRRRKRTLTSSSRG